MLKKCAILLLCCLYTISVYGIAYNVNYCGSMVQSVKIGSPSASCPMCHGMAKMKCCKTTHVVVKVKDAHLVNGNSSLLKTFAFALILPRYNSFTAVWQQAEFQKSLYHAQNAPPPGSDLILIKNCTFRI